jgi:DNA-binding IclR family transcriptional regulator
LNYDATLACRQTAVNLHPSVAAALLVLPKTLRHHSATVTSDRARSDVQSVHRAIDLLERIGHRGDAGVSELAREADLAVSTVHNLLRTLTRRGYLINAEGRYRLGPGISVLSSRFDPALALPLLLKPASHRISARTGLSTTATVLMGNDVHVLSHEPAPGRVTVSPPTSTSSHPFTMATGRLLVALTRHADWHSFIASAGHIEAGWSHARWTSYLAAVAQTAVCFKRALDPQGDAAIAVPIWSGDGAVICAIGCSSPWFFVTPDLFEGALDVLWDTTTELSARLGCARIPFPKPPVPANQD